MRLIDADSLCPRCTYNGDCMGTSEDCCKCEDYVVSYKEIRNAPTIFEWVGISDREPENGYWLVCTTSGNVMKDFYWDGEWEFADENGYKVVAWCALPKGV